MLMLWLSMLRVSSVVLVVVCTDPNPIVISVARDHSHHGSTHTYNENIHSKHDSSIFQASSDQYQSSFSDETVCSQPDGACEIHKIPEHSDSVANQDRFPRIENEVPLSDISSLHDDKTSLQRTELETLDQESKGASNSRTNEEQSHKDSAEITHGFGSNHQYSVLQDVSIKEDVNTSFSFKDKDGTTEGAGNTKGALTVLHQVGDFENFIKKGVVVIVYFYREIGSEALSRFLSEYSKSAEHLLQYHVLLSTVNCAEYNVATYCLPDKINRFAYGFRDGLEKIALPLDTLFNNNAIVASALHLALINSVPILQTSGERRDLEARCRRRCDIIFSFLHTLGTFEHRMFLEVAYAHQDSFVFAITTYRAGTLGLSDTHPEEERENTLWVVHCADKAADEECVVSHYRRKMEQTQLLQFIHALQLPMWHELALLPTTSEIVTPYDGSGLPWVLLLHDTSSHNRVRSLAPHLAQLLHGSVATMTVNLELVSEAALMKLGLARQAITAPAVAFLQPGQESASLLNDYDDALEWVNEQLSAMLQQVPLSKEEQGYLPVQALEELQQDDEVVLGMLKEDIFNNVPFLAGPVPYTSTLSTNTLSVIAFYLAWDPVSNALLQHLNAIASVLHDYSSQASLYRVNCFDWPNFCDIMGVSTYPVLRLHPKGRRNITYEGPIHGDYILKAILLYERATPLELVSTRELEGLLALNVDLHPACKVTSSVAVGIFPSAKDSVAFTEASRVLEGSHLMGRHISPHAVHTLCETNHGCVVVSKPGDKFQPSQVLNKEVDKPEAITRFVSHASLPVLAPLDPERYSALLVGTEKDEEYSPVSNQYVIILFLPANSSLPDSSGEKEFESRKSTSENHAQEDGRSPKGADLTDGPDDIWSMIGHLAAEFSEPGFVFSWLLCDDPLASELLPVYGLSPEVWSVVGVSQRESIVCVFTGRDSSEAAVRDWLNRLRAGHLQPSIKLPGREWEPRLPGFDYLKFMLEDQDRDAEDHLILEMEADLSAHHQQEESSEVKKFAHEEL